ncbi:dephospho-CoA kinase [Facilibium subflavum]|uniref:dephospho-CoA kinase n=1 Tax=Facilibium subflavum TaxID=2219058 RepID=UPI000E6594DA|nr:dephospho-CoA kinase [Facilibium subflavum]
MYAVGLTGGIGSGKTTVAQLFSEKFDIDVICADRIAKAVLQEKAVIADIAAYFGDTVLTKDGQVDRPILRQIITSNHKAREHLNQLTHPVIREHIHTALEKSQSPYTLIDIPLLTKDSLSHYPYLQKIITVVADKNTKITRIMQRDNQTYTQAHAMINSQISDNERKAFSDFVIENNGDKHSLLSKVAQIHQSLLSLALQPNT